MEPLRVDDERVEFHLNIGAEWGGAGGQQLSDAFLDRIPGAEEQEVKERKPNESLYNMKSEGHSRVNVVDGVRFEDVGPFEKGWIGRSEIRFWITPDSSVEAAHAKIEEWFDEAHDDEALTPLVTPPPLKAFHATEATLHTDDEWMVDADPAKCEQRGNGKKCHVDIDRWTIAYEGAELADSSWENDEPAKIWFDHRESYTVVLATEVGDLLRRFLDQDRLVVAEVPEYEAASAGLDW